MTLLQQVDEERRGYREMLRLAVRQQLREILPSLLPGQPVRVFGSLAKAYRFTEASDVDLALEQEPACFTVYQLTARLAEALGRPVDVVLLPECRFRDRIRKDGELWTPAA